MFYTVRDLVLKPTEHILLSKYAVEVVSTATNSDCIADPSGHYIKLAVTSQPTYCEVGHCMPIAISSGLM